MLKFKHSIKEYYQFGLKKYTNEAFSSSRNRKTLVHFSLNLDQVLMVNKSHAWGAFEMTDMNDYDDDSTDDNVVDDDEAKAAEKGAKTSESSTNDVDLAEAETLTVTAKKKQRDALEDEVAAFLARGGRIVEVPPDESAND